MAILHYSSNSGEPRESNHRVGRRLLLPAKIAKLIGAVIVTSDSVRG